jgi:two-component system response regulator MprA
MLTNQENAIENSAKRPHVLIVDDEWVVAETTRLYLEVAGFKATAAFGGAQGLRAAIETQPDVVISDMSMDDVNGIELLEKLKQAKVRTRFIFMTGISTDLKSTVKFIKLGACDVLHKPLDAEDVIVAINRALALDGTLATETALIIKLDSLLKELEDAQKDLSRTQAKLKTAEVELSQARWEASLLKLARERQKLRIKFFFLMLAVSVTLLFHSFGMVQSQLSFIIFPAMVFLLLSLPLDRIKALMAKVDKAESRATFVSEGANE